MGPGGLISKSSLFFIEYRNLFYPCPPLFPPVLTFFSLWELKDQIKIDVVVCELSQRSLISNNVDAGLRFPSFFKLTCFIDL